MDKIAERVAARFKKGSFEGPFAWMDKNQLRVWCELDSYGRVHHVTGDISLAEKALEKVRHILIQSQRDMGDEFGIFLEMNDVYIDGLPGGRNRMKMEFWARIKPTAKTVELGVDVEDTIAGYVPSRVTWKGSPPKS